MRLSIKELEAMAAASITIALDMAQKSAVKFIGGAPQGQIEELLRDAETLTDAAEKIIALKNAAKDSGADGIFLHL